MTDLIARAADDKLGRVYVVLGSSAVRIVATDQGCVQLEQLSTTDRTRVWVTMETWQALVRSGAVLDG